MMRNFKLTISYDGTRYCGWQIQNHMRSPVYRRNVRPSLQETIQQSLQKIFSRKISVVASGRTDSGVHALGQVAHCKINTAMKPQVLLRALNGNLPFDIRIRGVQEVPLQFHARYSAQAKTYRYIIVNQEERPIFLEPFTFWIKYPLNVVAMKKAARHFQGKHDFKAYCAHGSGARSTIRIVKNLKIKTGTLTPFSYRAIFIEIEANGFLYNMVRTIAGTLIEVGRGQKKPDEVRLILQKKERQAAGPCVPAQGLYLVNVTY